MNRSIAILALTVASLAPAMAQDAEAGKSVFGQCRACHAVGEGARNGVGPQLNGLIGRKAGSVEGYNYSDANKNSGKVWDEATFTTYIKDPKGQMPGTKMVYAGLKDETRIANLIAYLKTFGADGKAK
ncbi:MAG: cytochrome c family protein [Beijerinckiaceae bacterium]|jgi:cytochrome c|nr:cytochrome c family protein [Beijerinckiaceae bacterium]